MSCLEPAAAVALVVVAPPVRDAGVEEPPPLKAPVANRTIRATATTTPPTAPASRRRSLGSDTRGRGALGLATEGACAGGGTGGVSRLASSGGGGGSSTFGAGALSGGASFGVSSAGPPDWSSWSSASLTLARTSLDAQPHQGADVLVALLALREQPQHRPLVVTQRHELREAYGSGLAGRVWPRWQRTRADFFLTSTP